MTRISKYTEVATPDVKDLLLGTDVTDDDSTKNFTIQSVVDLIESTVADDVVLETTLNDFVNLNTFNLNQGTQPVVTIGNSLAGGGLSIGAGTGISANISYGAVANSVGLKISGSGSDLGTPLRIYNTVGSVEVFQVSSIGAATCSSIKTPTGTSSEYLMANGTRLVNVATNATTTALSLATLNSTYSTAITGYRVHCGSISPGKLTYEKTSTGWISYAVTLVS